MTTVMKAADAATLLGLIPVTLGFQPHNSIVLLVMSGNRSVGAMRFDLPTEGDSLASIASTMIGTAVRVPKSTGVIIVIYSDDLVVHQWATIGALVAVAKQVGFEVRDALVVGSNGFASQEEPLGTTHPLSDIGPAPAGFAVAEANRIPALSIPDELGQAIAESSWDFDIVDDVAGFAEHIATAEAIEPEDYARLYLTLQLPPLRDILIVTWATGRGAEAEAGQRAYDDGGTYPEDLARVLWGDAPQPDPSRLRTALDRVHVACVLDSQLAGAYATAAWLSWALGRSTHAEQYARLGVAAQPEHGLCDVVLTMVNAGHLPAWAFGEQG